MMFLRCYCWLLPARYATQYVTFGLYFAEREGNVQMGQGKVFPVGERKPKDGAHLRRSFLKTTLGGNSAYRFGLNRLKDQ